MSDLDRNQKEIELQQELERRASVFAQTIEIMEQNGQQEDVKKLLQMNGEFEAMILGTKPSVWNQNMEVLRSALESLRAVNPQEYDRFRVEGRWVIDIEKAKEIINTNSEIFGTTVESEDEIYPILRELEDQRDLDTFEQSKSLHTRKGLLIGYPLNMSANFAIILNADLLIADYLLKNPESEFKRLWATYLSHKDIFNATRDANRLEVQAFIVDNQEEMRFGPLSLRSVITARTNSAPGFTINVADSYNQPQVIAAEYAQLAEKQRQWQLSGIDTFRNSKLAEYGITK